MAQPPRTPPRFVPTLTEVVRTPDAVPVQGAPAGLAASARTTVMSSPLPPVVRPTAGGASPAVQVSAARPPLPSAQPPAVMAARPVAGAMAAAVPGGPAHKPPSAPQLPVAARPLPDGVEEYMVHRVMQRVDVVLDQRLREAIATVVQEQTRSVLPRLREEIESVVRHAVYEAVADELASGAPGAHRG